MPGPSQTLLYCTVLYCTVVQALLAVRPDLPGAARWQQRIQQIHETWADQLYTRDRDITPGEHMYQWQSADMRFPRLLQSPS
jgi:hypothetical protein